MKRNILTLFTVVFAVYGYAQNTYPYPENADIGIGTTTPSEKLDVNGNVKWNGFNSGNPRALKLGYSGGNYGGVGYNVDFTPTTGMFNRPLNDQSSYLEFWYGGFRFYGTSNANSVSGINLNGGTSNLNLFATLDRVGNFGIGTPSPAYKLDVSGDMRLSKPDTDPSIILHRQDWGTTTIGQVGATLELSNQIYHPAASINFLTKNGNGGSSSKMIVSNTGNVGIGTTNPLMAGTGYTGLDIRGNIGSSVILGTPGNIGAYVFASQSDFYVETPGFLALRSGGATERFRITADGKVGIGTTTPDAKLTVAGKIHSQEVKVTVDAGADFVFQKDYKLKPLTEVAEFIGTNKHLPEIASADEMKKNGLELGEMNIKLLQKIEELTLHLIEMDKNVSVIQSENKELKAEVSKLKSK